MELEFHETDNGNCRVYYWQGRKLRCFQEDARDKFTLYVCSLDGEPSYPTKVEQFTVDRLPDDDSSTAESFRKWFAANHEWQVWL